MKKTSTSDNQMLPCLQLLCKNGLKSTRILDIGANHGAWTLDALSVWPQAQIVMVEPQIEHAAQLKAIQKTNASCTLIAACCGPEEGEIGLTIWKDLAGSSVLPSADTAKKWDRPHRTVPMTTIDKIASETLNGERIDLIKLDIQGFEIEALRGATETIKNCECIITECSLFRFLGANTPLLHEMISFMSERGFIIYDIAGTLRRPFDNALGQLDAVFVKQDGALRGSNAWN